MHKKKLSILALIGASGLMLSSIVQANAPMWTVVPVAGYPPSVAVSSQGTATIKYTVTNLSRKPHKLQMNCIQGVTRSGCSAPLGYQQSCILTLTVNGSGMYGDVVGGPVLCDQGDRNLCYQPSPENSLAIRLTGEPPVQQYTVMSSAGTNGLISPSGSQTVNSGATLTFTATPNTGYGVNQWLLDGNLVQTGGTTYQLTNITTNHTVNVTFGTVTLTPSVSTLSLSINCQPASACTTTQNAALTGNPRQITIQNNGSVSATNVAVNTAGLPAGTTITGNTCTGTLTASSSCVITLTPGAVANSTCTSGTQPAASTITISADGGLSSQVDAYVLGYGCQYQGGFIYAVDDTTPNTGSIGGKVVTLVDQAQPYIASGAQATSIIWSSNGNGATAADVDYRAILGIDQLSTTSVPSPTTPAYPVGTPAFVPCNGKTDGACDSGNIVSYYDFNRTSGGLAPTPLTYYAAGLCKATINGYNDWYLPALCEMSTSGGYGCPVSEQGMLNNLSFLIGDPAALTPSTSCTPPAGTNCLAGYYWGSTEESSLPSDLAFIEIFDINLSVTGAVDKASLNGVRCSRAITF